MTACAAVLGLSEDIKAELLELGICDVLIPLTASPSVEVQGNAAAALGNLSSKTDDYSAFARVWDQPAGGMHAYLARFLESPDTTFQHIAVWTLVQLLESCDPTLERQIRDSPRLLPLVRALASDDGSAPAAPNDGGSDDEGEDEIRQLARKTLEFLAEDSA